VRRSLVRLERALGQLAVSIKTIDVANPSQPMRRKLTLSPARRAALKLQGQYMGYMRKLKPRQKDQVKAIRAKKGIRAGIAAARKLGSAA
jgi:hypothetical protein